MKDDLSVIVVRAVQHGILNVQMESGVDQKTEEDKNAVKNGVKGSEQTNKQCTKG